MNIKVPLTIAFALLLSACGYRLKCCGSILPPDVKKIYVAPVENFSTEAGFANVVTDALRERFDRFGVLTVVEDESLADASLRVKVLKVQRGSRSVTSQTDVSLQLDTNVTLAGDLKRSTGDLLWSNPRLQVSRAYGTTSRSVVTSSADFASGSLGASDLAGLSSREVARGQEQEAFEHRARVALEDPLVAHVEQLAHALEAFVDVDRHRVAVGEERDPEVEHQDGVELGHLLGRAVVLLHEDLRGPAGFGGLAAEQAGEGLLVVEQQAVLAAAGEVMQADPYVLQEALELAQFGGFVGGDEMVPG